MIKPLATSCFTRKKTIPTIKEFNTSLETVNIDDKIGHLFVVDIRLDAEKVNAKTIMYNEL